MNRSHVSGLLIAALVFGIALPTKANSLPTNGELIGATIGVVAVIAVVTILVVHHARTKRTVTGCVSSKGTEMTLTDEKDKHTYVLSGNSGGVTAGDRMMLRGKRIKAPGTALVWQTKEVVKDLGVCHA